MSGVVASAAPAILANMDARSRHDVADDVGLQGKDLGSVARYFAGERQKRQLRSERDRVVLALAADLGVRPLAACMGVSEDVVASSFPARVSATRRARRPLSLPPSPLSPRGACPTTACPTTAAGRMPTRTTSRSEADRVSRPAEPHPRDPDGAPDRDAPRSPRRRLVASARLAGEHRAVTLHVCVVPV
jgi:hypothetical protein